MEGFAGRVLRVDLTTGRSWTEPLEPDVIRRFLGGAGLAAYLLYRHTPPRADPLGPQNVLAFAVGGFAGTPVPAGAKYALAAKSPLTGFIGDSLSSSHWAVALKAAGYDALVISGAAPRWSYLVIDDDRVELRDAGALPGLDIPSTQRAVRAEVGGPGLRVAAIGPAGEHLVRYASIGNDGGRQAGRTGPGAVMGSKRLKAIAVRGHRLPAPHDPEWLQRFSVDLRPRVLGPATAKYRILGTNANTLVLDRLGLLPSRNFQASRFEGAEVVSAEHAAETYRERRASCYGCPVGCDHLVTVDEGKYAGSEGSAEYQSTYALGAACGIDDYGAILHLSDLCDRYGLDVISTGVCIGWAMECAERGLLGRAEADGLDLRFGNADAAVALVHAIARREGLGDLLSRGVRHAAQVVGHGSEAFAMHVKGLEMPGYDPRGLKTFALGLAVSTRGACHNRAPAYEPDLRGTTDRTTAGPGRGGVVAEREDFAAVFDSLALCKFIRGCFDDFYAEAAGMFTAVTGRPATAAEIRRAGTRVNTLKKAFNVREGWTRADDWLPPRVLSAGGTEPGLTPEDLRMLLDDYYAARGWTAGGLIPAALLTELELPEAADVAV